jgi:hypothetical protein
METRYIKTIYIFKKINPIKKYSQFTYTDLNNFCDVSLCYCFSGEIVKIENNFYEFNEINEIILNAPEGSIIQFQDRKKIIKEIKSL